MNPREFYLELGDIDDDLVQEAAEAGTRPARRVGAVRLAGIAACFCLLCAALLFGMRDIGEYNTTPVPPAAKLVVPSGEGITALSLSEPELFAHYGLTPFPDELAGLQKTETSHFALYQSGEDVVYDTNLLTYRSTDGTQTLSIVLSTDLPEEDTETEQKMSRIDGISLRLTVSERSAEPAYWAELCDKGVFARITAFGMEELAFRDALRELLPFRK